MNWRPRCLQLTAERIMICVWEVISLSMSVSSCADTLKSCLTEWWFVGRQKTCAGSAARAEKKSGTRRREYDQRTRNDQPHSECRLLTIIHKSLQILFKLFCCGSHRPAISQVRRQC